MDVIIHIRVRTHALTHARVARKYMSGKSILYIMSDHKQSKDAQALVPKDATDIIIKDATILALDPERPHYLEGVPTLADTLVDKAFKGKHALLRLQQRYGVTVDHLGDGSGAAGGDGMGVARRARLV